MSTSRGSDAEMDRLLHAALGPQGGEAAARMESDCPSAGEVAAFVDATLADDERGTMEVHLAGCSRCQEVLAAMATAPSQGEHARAPLTSDLGPRTSDLRWRLPAWGRWALPATAAIAVAVVLYVLVPMEQASRTPDAPPAQVASRISAAQPPTGAAGTADRAMAGRVTAKSEASPAPRKPKRAERAAPQATTPAAPRTDIAAVQPVPAPSEAIDAISVSGRRAGGGGIAGGVAGSGNVMAAAQPPPPAPLPILAAQKPAAAQPDADKAASDKARADKVGVVSESVQIVPASPLLQQTKALGFITAPAKTVIAASGQVKWQFVPGGQILRSSNAGASWHLQPATPPAVVLAASAPSPTVCWAVGRNGVVLVTADGETWIARSFTERVDLVGVEGRDALNAGVTTRDGRVFTTRDGGVTWTAGR